MNSPYRAVDIAEDCPVCYEPIEEQERVVCANNHSICTTCYLRWREERGEEQVACILRCGTNYTYNSPPLSCIERLRTSRPLNTFIVLLGLSCNLSLLIVCTFLMTNASLENSLYAGLRIFLVYWLLVGTYFAIHTCHFRFHRYRWLLDISRLFAICSLLAGTHYIGKIGR